MTPLTPSAQAILAVLDGRTEPMTIRDIAYAVNLPRRDAEASLQELALAGYPVVGDNAGMKLATDPAEVRACAEALSRRIAQQYLRVRALRRTADRMRQPATLWPELSA